MIIIDVFLGKKYKIEFNYKEKFELVWYILFGLALIFILVGFFYDIAMIVRGQIASVIYPVIYFVICFALVILSFFDFIFREQYFLLIIDDVNNTIVPEKSEENKEINDKNQNDNNNINNDNNKEEDKNEANKSKTD